MKCLTKDRKQAEQTGAVREGVFEESAIIRAVCQRTFGGGKKKRKSRGLGWCIAERINVMSILINFIKRTLAGHWPQHNGALMQKGGLTMVVHIDGLEMNHDREAQEYNECSIAPIGLSVVQLIPYASVSFQIQSHTGTVVFLVEASLCNRMFIHYCSIACYKTITNWRHYFHKDNKPAFKEQASGKLDAIFNGFQETDQEFMCMPRQPKEKGSEITGREHKWPASSSWSDAGAR